MKNLLKMLTFRRPHGSKTEAKFIKTFLPEPQFVDALGNHYYEVGEGATTLFVAHLDTVHHDEGIQEVVYDTHLEVAYKSSNAKDCLGADDGAGIWLLLEMMKAGVPGAYVFTRGEECGGLGAKHIAKNRPKFLARFKRAIAFDRRGTRSVITHQGYGRCCSDTFGQALANAFNATSGFDYVLDDTGVYTDTAEFTEFIPECTNISCGYQDEHTPREMLDVAHLVALRDACLTLDWEALPVERNPEESEGLFGLNYFESERTRYNAMEFDLIPIRGGYELWHDYECILSHPSKEFLEGYASCMADAEGREAVFPENFSDYDDVNYLGY